MFDNPCRSPDCPAESESDSVCKNGASTRRGLFLEALGLAALSDLTPLVFLVAAFALVTARASFFGADFFLTTAFLAMRLDLDLDFTCLDFACLDLDLDFIGLDFDLVCLLLVFFLVAIRAV